MLTLLLPPLTKPRRVRAAADLAKGGSEELYKKLNSAVFPGGQGGPLMHVIAGKAVALKEAMEPEFKTYQQQVAKNAKAMVEVFWNAATKWFPAALITTCSG